MNAPRISSFDNRRAWLGAIGAVQSLGGAADDLAALPPVVRALRGARLPVEGASAQRLGEAFVLQAQALLEAGTDWRRELCRRALAASAEAIEGLLIDEAARALRDPAGGD